MSQYDLQFSDLERIFRKQFKIILFCVVLSVAFCILFARLKVSMFQTSATVKIDRNSVMGLSTESVILGTWDNIETQTKVIKSFPVLLRAGKMLDMIPDSVSDSAHLSDEEIVSKLMGISSKISTSISSGTNIIEIAAVSNDRFEAKNLANAVAYAYKEFSIHVKKLHAQQTKNFIKEQLDKCQNDLSKIEHEIKRFEEEQKIPLIEVNEQRIIDEQARLEEQIAAIDNAISLIRYEEENLREWYSFRRRDTIAAALRSYQELHKATDTADGLSATSMGWISQISDEDPGLAKLNSRLIQLQIERQDQLSFYKNYHPLIKDLDSKIQTTIKQILAKYKTKVVDLNAKKAHLQALKGSVDIELKQLPTKQMTYARLKRQLDVTEKLNTVLTTHLQEALITDAGVIEDVTIMSLAVLPGLPANKNITQIAGIGLFLGIILGIIFAIIREMFDTSISTIKDVERTLKLTVLAVIPHIAVMGVAQKRPMKGKKKVANPDAVPVRSSSILTTHFNTKTPVAEAYRILRTNIEYILSSKPIKTILLTSATMSEGKSTTIANLSVVFAQQGKKVLLLELNMRRPSIARIFGYTHEHGVSDILSGKIDWKECVLGVTDIALGKFTIDDILVTPGFENLFILPFGHTPMNPTELISSVKMNQLLEDVKENFDFILVDGPPILPVADSIILSQKVDGVILVYMVGKTPRNSLRLAKDRLAAVQANILGLILNDVRPETNGTEYASYAMRAYTTGKEHRNDENAVVVLPSKLTTEQQRQLQD
ncbi:MAG: AAA family ATPase [Chitinivibrionales bacterium]|nr:AAA family ATPase [Chitinivibrionales bacterium]